MKKRILSIILFLSISFGWSQNWMNSAGSLYNDGAFDVEVDGSGNIYSTGYTTAQSNFGGNITINTNGFSDIYVSKSSSNGTFQWVKVFGGTAADRGYDLTLDDTGNIYITGYFQGTAYFDGFTITSNGSQDIFVAKLDNQGNVLWVESEGGPEGDTGYGIAVDNSGNVIITGQFKGQAQIGVNTFNSTVNPSTGQQEFDLFVSKYDPTGNNLWSLQGEAKYDDRGLSVDVDNGDNIYVTGQFSDTLTFAGNTHNNTIYNAGMLVKLDPNGNQNWFRRMGAIQTLVYDVEVDSQDEVIITGDFQGQMMILDGTNTNILSGNYQYRIFIIKFNEIGEVVWMREDDSDSEVSSKAIALDANDDIYISGTFKCVFDEYSDTLGSGLFNSVGFNDVFITKYDSQGDRQWFRQYGGPYDDYCSGIAIRTADNPVIAGEYTDFFNYPSGSSFITFNGINSYLFGTGNCPNYQDYAGLNAIGNKDIFVGQPVNLSLDHYYYYSNNAVCGEYAEPCMMSNCVDSIVFCEAGTVSYNTNTQGNGQYEQIINSNTTNNHIGPYFDFLWSDGTTLHEIDIQGASNSGIYTMDAQRIDGCNMYLDSIHVTIHPNPTLPLLTDDLGFNSNSFPYNDITFCNDTVTTYFTNLDSTYLFEYGTPDSTFNDSLSHSFFSAGMHNVSITDTNGCSESLSFSINVDSPFSDTIVPYILFDDVDTICLGESIDYIIADSLTNPTGNFQSFCSSAIVVPGLPCLDYTLSPTSTGWYIVNKMIALGYNNSCGIDTTHYYVQDSIYVVVLPVPQLNYSVTGQNLLCPGDVVQVSTSDTMTGFTWSGPGIVSTSTGGDTITVDQDGVYSYSGSYTDSVTGCSKNFGEYIQINYKDAPIIESNVPDNIICPGDSILLTCLDPALTYSWVGPQGSIIGSNQTIWITIPGFYHCIILDADSCQLTSNTIELKEYNTPYILPEPGTELCHSGAITLTAIYNGAPGLMWLPPINSTDSVVTVTQPGTYYLEVSQCGVTVQDSIVITQSNITAEITVLTDTMLCPGDTAVLMANSGMAIYEWTPNFYGQTFQTVQPGEYVVTITDGATGCTATSDTVTVAFHPGGAEPTIDNHIICTGDSVLLINQNSNLNTEWFLNDSIATPFLTGDSIQVLNITTDTIFYVENYDSICTSYRIPVSIEISGASVLPIISGDTVICEGLNLELSANNGDQVYDYTWVGPNSFTSNQNPILESAVDSTYSGYYMVTVSDGNCSETDSILVQITSAPSFSLSEDTIVKCFYDSVVLDATVSTSNILWNTGDTTSSITTFNSGVYTAQLINTGGCNSLIDTVLVENFTYPSTTYWDTTICSGDSVILSPVSGNIVDWFAYTDTVNIATDSILTLVGLESDTAFYTAETDSNGCLYMSNVIGVFVTPATGSVMIYGDTTLCQNGIISLTADYYPGATYEWTFNGNVVGTGFQYYHSNAGYADSGQYTVTITGVPCIIDTSSVNITIYSNPTSPQITGNLTYCEGDTIQLFGQNTQSGIDTLIWNLSDGSIFGGDTLIVFPANSGHNGNVGLYAVDSNQCVSDAEIGLLTINGLPDTPILNSGAYCEGENIMISPANSNPNANYYWQDSVGNILSYTEYLAIQLISYNQAGFYTLFVEENGCSDSASVNVEVIQYPDFDLGPDTIICLNHLTDFELEIDDNLDFYQWQDGSSDYFYDVLDTGYFYVTAGIGNCLSTDSIHISVDTCTYNYIAPNTFTPNGDGINDYFELQFPAVETIIQNRWGEIVFQSADKYPKWDGTSNSGKPVSEGVYFYVIKTEEEVVKGFVHINR